MLDYDKYLEIERRTDPGITQFEGLEDYRCIACELKKKSESESDNNESESDKFSGNQPITNSGSAKVARIRSTNVNDNTNVHTKH